MRRRTMLSVVALLATLTVRPVAAQPGRDFPRPLAGALSTRLDELRDQFDVVGVAAAIER